MLEVNGKRHGRKWFTFAAQPWSVAVGKAQRGETTAHTPAGRAAPLQVLVRDLYIHVDAARINNVPDDWTRSVCVIKLRLSGLRRGINQLRRTRHNYLSNVCQMFVENPGTPTSTTRSRSSWVATAATWPSGSRKSSPPV